MSDETPLPVTISIKQAWLLISGLQLAVRHPEMSDLMRQDLEHIGKQFQQPIIELHPECYLLIEHGWIPQEVDYED